MRKLTLAALVLLALALTATAQSPDDVVWQSSEHASVRLGVRDKLDTLGEYDATFFVTDARGRRHQKSITVRGGFGYVTFPDDFGADSPSGAFSWFCVVRGKAVLRGQFTLIVNADSSRRKGRCSQLEREIQAHSDTARMVAVGRA
jgi:hypothetical protein